MEMKRNFSERFLNSESAKLITLLTLFEFAKRQEWIDPRNKTFLKNFIQ